MKYCRTCGKEIADEVIICPNCGCSVESPTVNQPAKQGMKPTAIILGVLGIIGAWLLAIVGHILSICGIVEGIKEQKRSGNVVGLIISIIGEICAIISSVLGVLIMNGLA